MNTLLTAILLTGYGLAATDFVPSPLVAKGGLYLSVFVSLALGSFLSHGYITGTVAWAIRPPLAGRLFAYATFFVVTYCVAWAIFVRAAPGIATRIFGTLQSQTMVLEADYEYRRKGCDEQLRGPELVFPGYLCIPSGFGPFAPRGEVILSGKATVLGMHVTYMESGPSSDATNGSSRRTP